ncbi:MAG: TerB family tellurite resistance protein [Gammaproteobacteria bacterium]|nr:TerB family tellurite resistance protein [Gammaproteobacteria bacterium]NNF62293.1 hypothetical protein [Gammaproteobacteria bacterium]NNM21246.1 hypothetical protein [Gammaproteobacteria bacterium]
MGLADFSNLVEAFSGSKPNSEQLRQLRNEVALVTLARATSADTNIHPCEIETVQRMLKKITNEDIDAGEIRLAAKSGLFEKAPLSRYLNRAARQLEDSDRLDIARALAEVIRSDVRISPFETAFFDMVADALRLTPSQLVGLASDD